ncbi:MAG: hemerythrin family protein [Rhodospirillaceae bacterium]
MTVEWRKISSGDEGIDTAHKHLMELATAMDGACDTGDYGAISDDNMEQLLAIANSLFDLEKTTMDELGYPKTQEHIEEHEILIATIESALGRVRTRSTTLIKDAVVVMLFSISGHIETMDVPLADQISKKLRKPAVSQRRSSDPVRLGAPAGGYGAPGRRGGGAAVRPADGGEDGASLKTIIVNSYAATLLNLKASKGITGETAKQVAYEVVAKVVNKATGKKINAEFVKQIIISQ